MKNKIKYFLTALYVTCSILLFSHNISANIADGLVAYYPFEESTLDTTGQNIGIPHGDVIYVEGYVGKAIQLDGVGDYIDCGRGSIAVLENFTATAWIKTADAYSGEQPILGWHHSGFLNGWFLEKYRNSAQLYYGGDGMRTNSDILINDDKWHFVAVSYDAENHLSTIRVDDQIFERSVLYPPIASPANFVIGAITSGIRKIYFNGSIDEVRIYNRLLTEAEILEIVQIEQEPPTLPPAITINPVEYDFGNVTIGSSRNMVLSITNSGGEKLVIDAVELDFFNYLEPFSLTLSSTFPVSLEPQESLEVELLYTPTFLYDMQSNNLIVESNASNEAVSTIPVWGIGVLANNSSDAINDLLNYIDYAVKQNILFPIGPGNSTKTRIKTLKNMIKSAGDLLDNNDVAGGCDQLKSILKKIDGLEQPPDFVTGEAVKGIADGIGDLMINYDCESALMD